MQKRGQVSFEYLAIVSFITIIILFLLGISQYYLRTVETNVNSNQLRSIAKQIIDTSESVYFYGQPSKITLNLLIPEGIKEIQINSNEINFIISTQGGPSEVNYPSSVNLQGSLSSSPGLRKVIVEAKEGYVWINGT